MDFNVLRIYDSRISFITVDENGYIIKRSDIELNYLYYSEIENHFPLNFKPVIIYFHFPEYYFIPIGIENSEALTFALISDWNLNFILLKDYIEIFDYIFTDLKGVNTFKNHGLNNVSYFPLFPLQVQSYEGFNNSEKIYDICFIGNINDDIQVKRSEYLYKIASLAYKYKVFLASNIYGDEYKKALSQSKIIFNLSIRSELNVRVFEALNARSLLLFEDDNLEIKNFLKPDFHFVEYNKDNLIDKIEYYLDNDSKRNEIIDNAYEFVLINTQESFEIKLHKNMLKMFNLDDYSKKDKKKVKVTNILKSSIMSVQDEIYEKINENYQITENNPNSINLSLFTKKKDEIDYLKYINQFPNYIPLKINYIKYLFNNHNNKIEKEVLSLIDFVTKKELSIEYFDGFIVSEKFTRFSVEYEKYYAEKNIEGLKNAVLFLLYNIASDISQDLLELIDYLKKADNLFESAKLKISIANNLTLLENKLENPTETYNYYFQALKLNPFNWSSIYYLNEMSEKINIEIQNQEWLTIIDSSPIFEELEKEMKNYNEKYLIYKSELIKKYSDDKNIIFNLMYYIYKKFPDYIPQDYNQIIIFADTYFQFKNYKKAIDLYAKSIQILGKKDMETINKISQCLKELGDVNTIKKLN